MDGKLHFPAPAAPGSGEQTDYPHMIGWLESHTKPPSKSDATIATLTAENERLRFLADWLAERLETANRCASGGHYDESKSEAALAEYAAHLAKGKP